MGERQQKEKDRILRRIMNTSVRFMGMGFRQALQWTLADRAAEIALMAKQRGIMRRIVDSNVRLMSAGWNKLLEAHKARNGMLKEKLRFVIETLTDKDAAFTLMAYNQLKQRKLALEGVGFGDDVATKLKIRLLRKLTDMGFNLQVMGVNAVKEFLTSEREREEADRLEFERQQKEKDRILRRMEGQKGNVDGQTQVCYQSSNRQGCSIHFNGLQRHETENAHVERCWYGRCWYEEMPIDQETNQPRL